MTLISADLAKKAADCVKARMLAALEAAPSGRFTRNLGSKYMAGSLGKGRDLSTCRTLRSTGPSFRFPEEWQLADLADM